MHCFPVNCITTAYMAQLPMPKDRMLTTSRQVVSRSSSLHEWFGRALASMLAATFGALAVSSANAQLWIADTNIVSEISLSANRVDRTIASAKKVMGVAVAAPSGNVWVLTEDKLTKYLPSGESVFMVELKAAGLEGAEALAIDRDETVWIAGVNGKGTLFALVKLDANGTEKLRIANVGRPDALVSDLDGVAWILASKQIRAYSSQGIALASIDAKSIMDGEPKHLAVDAANDLIWIAGEKRVVAIRASAPVAPVVSRILAESVRGLAIDAMTGTLWTLTNSFVQAFDATGMQVAGIPLASAAVVNPRLIVMEPRSRSVVVAHNTGVTRFPPSAGQPVTIALNKAANLLSAGPVSLATVIALQNPLNGSLINTATPEITLKVAQTCSDLPCTLPLPAVERYQFSIKLNGTEVGSAFTYDAISSQATYRPTTPLPQDTNSLTARATDGFGNQSNLVSSLFNVDSIPPSIFDLLPPSGTITRTNLVKGSGRLSEPASVNVDGSTVATNADRTFTFDSMLREGQNSLMVVATDLAGNIGTRNIAITLDTIPPAFIDLVPASGLLTNRTSVDISGKLSEEATLTIGSEAVPLTTALTFSKTYALVEGMNQVVLTATDRAGNATTHKLTITRDTIPPKLRTVTPASGATVSSAQVRLTGTFDDAISVELVRAGISQSTSGSSFVFDIVLQTGTNVLVLTAIDAAGNRTEQTISLTLASAYEPEDVPFMAVWDGFKAALLAGEKAAALEYVAFGSRERYERVFDDLSPSMPEVFAGLYNLKRMSVEAEIAEYFVNQREEGTNREMGFFVYFVKESDGAWRILSM